MRINKKTIFFFLAANAVLIAFYCFLHFYYRETIFIDFEHPQKRFPQSWVMLMTGVFVRFMLYIGIFWLIKRFNEKRWITTGFAVFVIFQFVAFISPIIFPIQRLSTLVLVSSSIYDMQIIWGVYLIVAFAFIKTKAIKPWLILFAVLLLLNFTLYTLGAFIYDHLWDTKWVLINQGFLSKLPVFATFVVFVNAYNKVDADELAKINPKA